MGKKQKYYVVWSGHKPGIYTDWDSCKVQIEGVKGARYKSFESREAAEEAYRRGPEEILRKGPREVPDYRTSSHPPVVDSLAVDAACSGNPGVMEYRGVYVASATQVFHQKFPLGTNNIGEFLGIVHGLAYLKKHHLDQILYSDSVNAINWVKAKSCRSKLPYNEQTAPLWDIVHRAEVWLLNNTYTTEIRKWDTDSWGEIPADFGRK